MHKPPVAAVLLCLVPVLSGCGEQRDAEHDLVEWSALADLERAPAPVRTAAAAVVRVQLASGASGTGFFVSADGHLITNNHVLGMDMCAREGCFVDLDFDYQRGAKARTDQHVFAKPIAVSSGYDLAHLQVWSVNDTHVPIAPLNTPFLTISPRDARSLVGTTIHVVGHPVGGLKKWSTGTVLDDDGSWFWSDAQSLPGNSGSPVLNDQGQVVGLLHRGSNDPGAFTRRGFNFASFATGSDAIVAAMSPGSAAEQNVATETRSIEAPTPEDVVVEHVDVYFQAGRDEALVASSLDASAADVDGGVATDAIVVPNDEVGPAPSASPAVRRKIVDVLAAACDKALAQTGFSSAEALVASAAPCRDAVSFLGCDPDSKSIVPLRCPDANERLAWTARFDKAAARELADNGQVDYFWYTTARGALASSVAEGRDVARSVLLERTQGQRLDLELAVRLVRYGATQFGGVDLVTFVRNFRQVPGWEFHATEVGYSLFWLAIDGRLPSREAVDTTLGIVQDNQVEERDYLQLESLLYDAHVLQ